MSKRKVRLTIDVLTDMPINALRKASNVNLFCDENEIDIGKLSAQLVKE